jgi:hypothetical protein
MNRFREFAIVSSFMFEEDDDGEQESKRVATELGAGAGSIDGVAADEKAEVADSPAVVGVGREVGCRAWSSPDRSGAEAELLFLEEAGRSSGGPP